MAKLSNFKCLVFDVYATLIVSTSSLDPHFFSSVNTPFPLFQDWESGILSALEPIMSRSSRSISTEEALREFGRIEIPIQQANPTMLYSEVLSRAHAELATLFGVPDVSREENITFGYSVGHWRPFPDTVQALERLSKRYKLVVLSNVDRKSFSGTRKQLEHGFAFDKVCTAQDIGSYKPNPANFEYVLKAVKDDFGIEAGEVLVTAASLSYDHRPANKLGLASAWIERPGSLVGVDEERDRDVSYAFKFGTMGNMADEAEKVFSL